MRTTCQAKKLSGLLSYLRSAGKYHRKGFRSNLPDHDTAEKLCCFFSAIHYYFTPQEGDKIQEKEVTIPWSNKSSQITREQIWDQINATPRAWIKKDQKYTCIRFNPLKQITLLKKKLEDENPPKRLKPLPSHTSQNLPFVLCSTRCYDWFSGNAQTFLWFWSIRHHHHPRFPPCCNTDVKIVYKFDESMWSHSKDKQLTKII